MSGRSYLSIGDVLSLLREEFPDVTISKIRFLESQGLVDPERSPSGYRKFYDEDVARLRWVLRKQRDQFLPLKVIRDRLAAAGKGVPPDDEPGGTPESPGATSESSGGTPESGEPGLRAAGGGLAARERTERRREDAPVAGRGDAAEAPFDEGEASVGSPAGAPVHANGTAGAAASAGAEPEPVATSATSHARHAAPPEPQRPPELAASGAPAAAPGAVPSNPNGEVPATEAARNGAPVAGPAASRPAARADAASRRGPEASRPEPGRGAPRVSGSRDADALSSSVSGVSLTLAELCAATGLEPQTVAALEGLGLLSAMSVAGGTFYDEEALAVGKLAAEFGRYGIEPRHLRLYRNSVDRESGLVEQVIMPLLRQRNPEARQRAMDAAADLARLGQGMRASLVRTQLRRLLGG